MKAYTLFKALMMIWFVSFRFHTSLFADWPFGVNVHSDDQPAQKSDHWEGERMDAWDEILVEDADSNINDCEMDEKTTPEQPPLIVFNKCHLGCGFFSVFSMVVGVLNMYETGDFSGLIVDLEDQGFYYDPSYGMNWWSYYFEPIRLGKTDGKIRKKMTTEEQCNLSYEALDYPRYYACDIIRKYIKVKKRIENKVQCFYQKNMKPFFVIGVHYRGTDKVREAPRVTYASVLSKINDIICDNFIKKFKIYVATDEQDFLKYIIEHFPQQVIFLKDGIRSSTGEPIHSANHLNYKKGEDAIMDCLLLSKCDFLIRTSSNLSWASSCFNPNLPMITLNRPFEYTPYIIK